MARPSSPSRSSAKRPVLYQLCRAGERFEVGDGPVALSQLGPHKALVIGRGDPRRSDVAEGRVFVDDPWMSSRHAQIAPLERSPRPGTDSASVRNANANANAPGTGSLSSSRFVVEDAGSTNGILVNGVQMQRAPLLHGDLIETGRTFWLYVEESSADALLSEPFELGGVSTWTPSFARQLADLLPRVPSAEHILVMGPVGTGKGFLARTIHVVSGRAGRFVHLDCRERRAKRLLVDIFGDDTHAGRLRDADGGTLFLENVDTLPLDVQDRLVEAVRRRSFTPEGRTGKTVALAARIVASMNVSADEAISEGTLRPALVDALGGAQLRMPTIQQRLPDLGLLLDDFIARARGAPAISRDACRCVLRYSFRQHVRAMARTIEGAATLAGEPDLKVAGGQRGTIEVVHLPVDVVGPGLLRQIVGAQSASATGVPENTSEMAAVTTGSNSNANGASEPAGEPAGEQWFGGDDVTDPTQQRPSRRPAPTSGNTPPHGTAAPLRSDLEPDDTGGHVDADTVAAALKAAHGNVSAAARALGRPRAVVLRWMREFRLETGRYRQ